MAAARGVALGGQPPGRGLDDQFAPAVQRRPLSARRAGQVGLGRRRRDARRAVREGRQAGREKTRPAPRQTARLERVLARRADRDERGSPARADRLRRLRNRARSRAEAPMRRRPQPPGTRPGRNVSPGHGEQVHLLRSALLLRSGQRGTSRRRVALGYRGPQAKPAHERALPRGSGARHIHRRPVAPLPYVTRQDPGIPARLAGPGARRGDPSAASTNSGWPARPSSSN